MIGRLIDRIFHRQKPTWAERHFTFLLVIGVVVAAVLSLSIGLKQSVWFDEAYSIIVAKQSFAQVIHLTALDTHPPLYYLLLKVWAGLFGWSELALRSLSVLAMSGAAAIGLLMIKRLFGVRAALVTLPFVVFAPFLLRYGFEIRMYAVASLIGIAATYVLVVAQQAKERQKQWKLYALYAVLVALGVYTLYYMVLLWLAHLVWLMWLTRREKRQVTKSPWFMALLGSIALFLPWLPIFVSQIFNGALAAISQPLTIDNLAGIISFMFVYQPTWQLSALVSLLVLFVIVTLSVFTVKALKIVSVKQRPYLVLLVLYVLVPVAVLALVSLARPMYVERYLSHVLIAGSLFVGVITALVIAKKPSKLVLSASAGLLVVMFVGVAHLGEVGNYNFQRLQKPLVRELAATITDCNRDTTVFAADPYVAIELAYYLPTCEIRFYSEPGTLKGGYAPLANSPLHITDPQKELATSRKVVYVYYDQPALRMPENLTASSRESFGPMNAAVFNAE